MNIKQYPIAADEDTGEVALVLALNFDEQSLALIQPDEDDEVSIVVMTPECVAHAWHIISMHLDSEGKMKEDKVVN